MNNKYGAGLWKYFQRPVFNLPKIFSPRTNPAERDSAGLRLRLHFAKIKMLAGVKG